jgi:hypothetical protein
MTTTQAPAAELRRAWLVPTPAWTHPAWVVCAPRPITEDDARLSVFGPVPAGFPTATHFFPANSEQAGKELVASLLEI